MTRLVQIVLWCSLAAAWGSCGAVHPDSRGPQAPAEASSIIDKAENEGVFDERLVEVSASGDPEIRARLARALARIGDPRGCPAVAELMRDDSPQVAAASVFAAGALAPDRCPSLARDIAAKLRTPRQPEPVLVQAALSAGRLGARAPWESLRGLARQGPKSVRVAALEALGLAALDLEVGAEEIVETAVESLFARPLELRRAAAFALGRWLPVLPEITGGEVAGHLAAIAEGDLPLALRSEAAVALARAGRLTPKTLSVLVRRDPRAAARALARGEGGDCRLSAAALPLLAEDLENPAGSKAVEESDSLLEAAAGALVRACPDMARVAERIDEVLSGESPYTGRPGAGLVRCLARLVSNSDDIRLLACDPDYPFTGRTLLAARLASRAVPGTQAWKTLMEMTGSENPRVMVAAITALGRIPGEASKEILEGIAAGERPLAAKAAVRALVVAGIPAPAGVAAPPEVRPMSVSAKESRRASPVRVELRTTRGDIVVELFTKIAPAAAAAFIDDARRGVFDDSPIWGVEPGDIIRAGDPTGTGLVDVSGWIPWEISEKLFERGTVGLESRIGISSRARFFITTARLPELDGKKTALGRVVEGMNVADSLLPTDEILSVEPLPQS